MSSFTRSVAILTLICFIGSMAACTTCKQRYVIKTADDIQSVTLNPEKKYEVKFVSGEKFRIKGDSLRVRSDTLGIKYNENDDFHYYRYSQINHVCERGFSGGKTAALVGGIVCAVVGLSLGITYSIAASLKGD